MKKTWIFLGIAFLSAAIWYFFSLQSSDTATSYSRSEATTDDVNGLDTSEVSTDGVRDKSVISEVHQPDSPNNEITGEENNEWLRSRGFTDEYNMFFSQIEYLDEEARNGNVLALQLRGYQQLGTEHSEELLTEAAMRGSIKALYWLSTSSESIATGKYPLHKGESETNDAYETRRIRSLEYLLVAELRGDHAGAATTASRLVEKLGLQEDEIALACTSAVRRYDELEQSRTASGLPSYDNTPPPVSAGATFYSRKCN